MRRIEAVRRAIDATDFEDAARNLLEVAAVWTPDALAAQLSLAMDVAALEGREAVFRDADEAAFATDAMRQEFREQIEFLTQKRDKPTRAWTDAMHGDHDRAFVVAGVTDMAMLDEFHTAVVQAAQTYDIKAFGAEFDRLVEKYGWSYNGGRNWRVRTIFETNIRTSYMAGRLRQMRDPDVVRMRPYWEYSHADTRIPLVPRIEHASWDGLVLRHDDPWWNTHFPPNDWRCSCGVHTLSEDDLRARGKDGPDTAPELKLSPFLHKTSGQTVMLPDGIGFGWDYMPGDKWERGLVPSGLIDEAGGLIHEGRHAVKIDTPEPMDELLAKAKPFSAEAIAAVDALKQMQDPTPEDLIAPFLERFGAQVGEAVTFTDKAGVTMPISDALFRDRGGAWKIGKRFRGYLSPLLAEALLDPDEIWLGVAAKSDPVSGEETDFIVDRRYIRADPDTGLIIVFEMGRLWWEAVTAYQTTKKGGGRPDLGLLDRRRGGKLLWKRK